ncbi:hypothetical protein JCM6882_004371 [Rhodosporidiobolus microsporus]
MAIAPRPVPQVQSFNAKTVTPAELVEALRLAGGVIIRNFVDHPILDQIERELRPFLAPVPPKDSNDSKGTAGVRKTDEEGNVEVFDEQFFPKQSRRATAMIEKSETSAREIMMHPLYQAVVKEYLTSYYTYWQDQERVEAVSEPYINNSICFSIMPGATNQVLHRDDLPQHIVHEEIEEFPKDVRSTNREACLGLFVAGKPATKENGATRLNKGDAFMMLGSCFHGGSANHTDDQERLIFSLFYVRGYLRQEENYFLSVDPAKVAKWPVEWQRAIGYYTSIPANGWVEHDDPRKVLKKYGADV